MSDTIDVYETERSLFEVSAEDAQGGAVVAWVAAVGFAEAIREVQTSSDESVWVDYDGIRVRRLAPGTLVRLGVDEDVYEVRTAAEWAAGEQLGPWFAE